MKRYRILLFTILGIALLYAPQLFYETTYFTSFVANFLFRNNFHEVDPGKFYRSAEMPSADLTRTIEEYGIKTVIDLRAGKDEGEGGVTEENLVNHENAKYVRFPLVGSKIPSRETVQSLLDIYQSATPPILVHCSSGTHRSGVASALWLMDREGQSVDDARQQLSRKYGFFLWERQLRSYLAGHPTIDAMIWNYEQDHKKTGIDLRTWISSQLK